MVGSKRDQTSRQDQHSGGQPNELTTPEMVNDNDRRANRDGMPFKRYCIAHIDATFRHWKAMRKMGTAIAYNETNTRSCR